MLRDLFMNGQSSITDTVGRTGLAQSKVSTSVAKLRDRGWVVTTPDPGDGRKTLAAVTEQVKLEGDRRRALSTADPLTSRSQMPTPPSENSSPPRSNDSISCSSQIADARSARWPARRP